MEGRVLSVYKTTNSHSFAALAQEGPCRELETFIGASLPFEGLVGWGGILEWFSKCYLDAWGLGASGHDFSTAFPYFSWTQRAPPQPWGPLTILSALCSDWGPRVQSRLSLSRDEPTPLSPLE